jgi:hypothetical protein
VRFSESSQWTFFNSVRTTLVVDSRPSVQSSSLTSRLLTTHLGCLPCRRLKTNSLARLGDLMVPMIDPGLPLSERRVRTPWRSRTTPRRHRSSNKISTLRRPGHRLHRIPHFLPEVITAAATAIIHLATLANHSEACLITPTVQVHCRQIPHLDMTCPQITI